jgi:3-hydroxyisobutyrate dehydrogenase-like beta-hydroxyacid dehydrogenase
VTGPSIGFIGFGEAGFHIASGLKDAGVESVCAFDVNAETPGFVERIRRHSEQSAVPLVDSPEDLANRADILMSTVVASAALDAARRIASSLDGRHLYADLNSVSPESKQEVAAAVTVAGARFVEITIMSPVPPRRHRSPMLLSGAGASEFAGRMAPYGMQLEVISERVGAAAAVKLCRSIIVKGLEALMVECALAACHYGADERVFSSLDESFPGLNWGKLADYMTSRVALHGERRAREMEEAARMLDAIGIAPVMAEAAARRQDWCAALGLAGVFDGAPPEDYRAIAAAIRKLMETDPRNGGRSVLLSATEDSYNG